MARHRKLRISLVLPAVLLVYAGCSGGPSVNGSFERAYEVSGPVRLELANAAGEVNISGGSDGKVHVHADVRASDFGFDNPQKRLDDTIANPPVEQKGDTIRIGKDASHLRNISIAYTIQAPHNTEVDVSVASGAQTIRGVRGPVKAQAASGSIRVEHIDRDVQLTTMSGAVSAADIDSDARVTSASGSVRVSNVKGDVRISAFAGTIQVSNPGGRVEADTKSGSVEIQGASNDVKAHAVSGRVSVQGNPKPDCYWDLKTISGGIQLIVPPSANFHLSADAVSGEIRADIPIMIEEQGKHTLRARLGNDGARAEVHTVSGEIRVSASK
ncbi:MAG TPA: DUF4097 family beta strand repeat-containing protein [Candidatus Acidoferrum sp.]|nr:DUF4097 family beta strand repeat-containing protein [Candidatus Acidoferrum sp.]